MAEDHELNQIIAREMIAPYVPKLIIVANGSLAIEMAMREDFDLILLDCHMPVTDGFEAATKIRDYEAQKGPRRTPIVAITADVTLETQEQCRSVGMDYYLSKPLDPRKLEIVLERFLSDNGEKPEQAHLETTGSPAGTHVAAPIDFEDLGSRFCNNDQLVRIVLEEFEKQLESSIGEIERCFETGDSHNLFMAAHALNGAAAAAGARQVREITRHLEHLGKYADISGAAGHLENLRTEAARCFEVLRKGK